MSMRPKCRVRLPTAAEITSSYLLVQRPSLSYPIKVVIVFHCVNINPDWTGVGGEGGFKLFGNVGLILFITEQICEHTR